MRRFLAKAVVFTVSLAAILLGSEALLTSTTAWRQYEDPRTQILWDATFDGSRLVLLGGSEFASMYVDSDSDRLCIRLEAYTGQRVFPGALNGARPPDVLAGAEQISREWPAGTIVFIGLAPTRFVATRAEEPPGGNFADIYFRRYGIDTTTHGLMQHVREQTHRLFRPFFAIRTRRVLEHLVDRPRPPGWMRRRSWLVERTGVPKARFEYFERNLIMGAGPRSFEWLRDVQQQLETAGIRPVFVLTPLNTALVHSFASRHPAESIFQQIHQAVAASRTQLEKNHAEVIDLTDLCPGECFFDLVHPNTCGDDLIARSIAEWLRQHTRRAGAAPSDEVR